MSLCLSVNLWCIASFPCSLCNFQARVRFAGADSAKQALEKINETVEGKVKVDDVEVHCSVLEGECFLTMIICKCLLCAEKQ